MRIVPGVFVEWSEGGGVARCETVMHSILRLPFRVKNFSARKRRD